MDISNDDAVLFERLASRVIGTDASLRAPADVLAANELGQNSLWPHGISGDLPILLVRVVDDDLTVVRQALEAQEYWRLKGIKADLVILNEHPVSYLDEVQSRLTALHGRRAVAHVEAPAGRRVPAALRHDGPGRARAVHGGRACGARNRSRRPATRTSRGRRRRRWPSAPLPALAHAEAMHPPAQPSMSVGLPALTLTNGIGGFADDGRTYAIVLEGDQDTPAPWVNVIANPALRHDPQRERIGDDVVARTAARTG